MNNEQCPKTQSAIKSQARRCCGRSTVQGASAQPLPWTARRVKRRGFNIQFGASCATRNCRLAGQRRQAVLWDQIMVNGQGLNGENRGKRG